MSNTPQSVFDLTTRSNTPQSVFDLTTRSMSVRAASANEDQRSIEATISTDAAVQVYDWRRGELIDEVLRTDGAEMGDQLPLLDTHDRYSLDGVLGSARELRVDAHSISARLFFTRDDDQADKAWNKARQGHLTDVSVGYRVDESVELQPNQSQTIDGREFTAGERPLRIATRWALREVSLVPIGADKAAKIRDANQTIGSHLQTSSPKEKDKPMDELRAYLESLGLPTGATDKEVRAYHDGLDGVDKIRADQLLADAQATPPPEGTRTAPPEDTAEPERSATPPAADDMDAAVRRGIEADRQRGRDIRKLAGDDVSPAIVQRAVEDGWDTPTATAAFLEDVRGQRQAGPGIPGSAPAIHSRSREADCNIRSLAAGMMAGRGMDPTQHSLHSGQRQPRRADQITEQDADRGEDFRGLSAVDLARECAMLDTGRAYRDPEEAVRAAMSGTSLDSVFTTNVYAELIAGWAETPDSTTWCQEEDVPNFLAQEDITLNAQATPDRHPPGATAKHATAEDTAETYQIYRFSKQFVADQQHFLNDRLGALMQMPRELGEAARRVRPDLVYAILHANAAMADTGALFNNTAETTAGGHANLTTAVLGSVGLKAAITAMRKHRIEKKVLNISPRYLLIPVDLEFTAGELLASIRVNHTGDTDAAFPDINLLSRLGITAVVDDRLGAAGCTDPVTGTARTGSATNWFLAGERRTIKVAYLRGTNRQPALRSFQLDRGQWGMGWDVKLDIGAKAIDYRALHSSTGAG